MGGQHSIGSKVIEFPIVKPHNFSNSLNLRIFLEPRFSNITIFISLNPSQFCVILPWDHCSRHEKNEKPDCENVFWEVEPFFQFFVASYIFFDFWSQIYRPVFQTKVKKLFEFWVVKFWKMPPHICSSK